MAAQNSAAKNLLVVEDNATNRKLLMVTLQAEGFTVHDAFDGIEDLAVLERERVDAIISDILMPRMDGFRLCHEVRRNPKTCHMPFIIYTGTYTSLPDEQLALKVGVDKYLRKPASTRDMLAAIREACAGPRAQARQPAAAPPEAEVMKEYSEALVRKLEETNDDLAHALAQQECLAGLSQRGLANIDLRALMSEAAQAVVRHLGVDYCGCWEVLPDGQGMLLRAGAGWKDGVVGSAMVSCSPGDSQAAYTLQSDQPVVVEELGAEKRFHASSLLFEHAAVSGISVAIRGAGQAIGALSAHTTVQRHFRPEEIHFLQAVANVLAAAAGRRRTEETLHRTVDELRLSNDDLSQFAYVASHDLQEPLRMISGFLRLLEERYAAQLDDKAREYIGFAVEGSHRMSRLIADVLAYSRVERKGEKLSPMPAGQALLAALNNLRGGIEEAGAEVTQDDLPTVLGDARQLTQLFQNLIGNALKFRSPSRPCKIHVSARREDGQCIFSVRDNGIGIPQDQFDRIFVIFQRLHTREKYPGTGIGLAICKKIVERHGGTLWVESKIGEGSLFRFTLLEGDAA